MPKLLHADEISGGPPKSLKAYHGSKRPKVEARLKRNKSSGLRLGRGEWRVGRQSFSEVVENCSEPRDQQSLEGRIARYYSRRTTPHRTSTTLLRISTSQERGLNYVRTVTSYESKEVGTV